MKESLLVLIACSLVFVLAGCGGGSSSAGESTAVSSQVSQETKSNSASAAEPDFIGVYVGEGDTDFLDMTTDEFVSATGGAFTESTASKYDVFDEDITAEYSLGKKDSMLGGRLKLAKEYELTLVTEFKSDKLKAVKIRIDKLTKDEAVAVCDDFIKALDGKLPEGYERFPDSERGKTVEVGFTKSTSDNIFSMTRSEDLDGDYYVFFDLENYAERYGM